MREATDGFALDPALGAEALGSADLPLCRLLLRDESRFPWVVLIPRRPGLREPWDLLPGERAQLWSEAERVGVALSGAARADKMNLAAFGNICPQLHLHLIARRVGDAAWPGSAVGLPREPYASPPPFWSSLLARLDLKERQRP